MSIEVDEKNGPVVPRILEQRNQWDVQAEHPPKQLFIFTHGFQFNCFKL